MGGERVLVLIRGVSGAGKTTFAEAIRDYLPRACIFTDDEHPLRLRFLPLLGQRIIRFWERLFFVLWGLVTQGFVVIDGGGNLRPWHRNLYYKVASCCQAEVVVVEISAPDDVVLAHLKQRALTHGTPFLVEEAQRQLTFEKGTLVGSYGRQQKLSSLSISGEKDPREGVSRLLSLINSQEAAS